VANALAGAYEYLIRKNSGKHIDVSRLFIYYNARLKDPRYKNGLWDNGVSINHGVTALEEFGCCKEYLHPFDNNYINTQPSAACYEEAIKYRIVDSMSIATDLDDMKSCLAEGYPFVFGLATYPSFLTAKDNGGYVPMPNRSDEHPNTKREMHAMLAVGYDDYSRSFIVRNSYGEKWGDRGYGYIPYDYMGNPELCKQLHTIKAISGDSHSRLQEDNQDYDPYGWISDNNNTDYYAESNYVDPSNSYNSYEDPNYSGNYYSDYGFQEPVVYAEDYLSRKKDEIKSSSKLQIICRGFYKDENKNPLNLLFLLNQHRLKHVPVLVFTQDKAGLQHHLQNQAPSMDLNDWKQRLFITSSSEELLTKIKQNISNKEHPVIPEKQTAKSKKKP
ncbi:unnamed protein product, partial [Rotaria sp. Silwood1]